MRYLASGFGLAFVLAAPALATPDHYYHAEPAIVGAHLANMCIGRGGQVVEQDQFHVLCERDVSGLQGVLTQFVIGNSYSTTPRAHIRFAIIPDPVGAHVQAMAWIDTQMAFGQTRRVDLTKRSEQDLNKMLSEVDDAIEGKVVHPKPINKLPSPDQCKADPNTPLCD